MFAALHSSKLAGSVHLLTGINVAQLALKHRQNKNQRQRVVAFVGSPVADTEESLEQLAKKAEEEQRGCRHRVLWRVRREPRQA